MRDVSCVVLRGLSLSPLPAAAQQETATLIGTVSEAQRVTVT